MPRQREQEYRRARGMDRVRKWYQEQNKPENVMRRTKEKVDTSVKAAISGSRQNAPTMGFGRIGAQ